MAKIHILDDILINKIAAGEVIERPYSVVKELIENSLDSGAKKILVETKDCGLSQISVSDDGEGMLPEDATLSIMRHATSKIKSADDLFSINSLGFRGEALASIAAVSDFFMRTKTSESSEGIEIFAKAGKIVKNSSVVCNRGTAVTVKDLFYNVPARKKHMKPMQAEFGMIADIVSRYALSNPEVYFQLVNESRTVIDSPGTANILGKIASVYGWKMTKSLLPINYSSGGIEVIGFVSKPEFTRGSRDWQSLYINKRYVKNKTVNDAVYSAYHTFLGVGRHPIYVIMLDISPDKIDVNVHPTKMEIRVADEAALSKSIIEALTESLSSVELFGSASGPGKNKYASSILSSSSVSDKGIQKTIYSTILPADGSGTFPDGEINSADNQNASSLHYAKQGINGANGNPKQHMPKQKMAVIGQINCSYILIETEDGFMLVDQHAAHERVMYEKFMEQFSGKGVDVQELLSTLIIDLSPQEKLIVDDNSGLLLRLGFKLEEFGKSSFALRTVPFLFGRSQHINVLQRIIEELKCESTGAMEKSWEERIIRKACRAAIKANEKMEQREMVVLMNQLFNSKNPYTCPHGRPTMVRFAKADIEKMFKRIV